MFSVREDIRTTRNEVEVSRIYTFRAIYFLSVRRLQIAWLINKVLQDGEDQVKSTVAARFSPSKWNEYV